MLFFNSHSRPSLRGSVRLFFIYKTFPSTVTHPCHGSSVDTDADAWTVNNRDVRRCMWIFCLAELVKIGSTPASPAAARPEPPLWTLTWLRGRGREEEDVTLTKTDILVPVFTMNVDPLSGKMRSACMSVHFLSLHNGRYKNRINLSKALSSVPAS